MIIKIKEIEKLKQKYNYHNNEKLKIQEEIKNKQEQIINTLNKNRNKLKKKYPNELKSLELFTIISSKQGFKAYFNNLPSTKTLQIIENETKSTLDELNNTIDKSIATFYFKY